MPDSIADGGVSGADPGSQTIDNAQWHTETAEAAGGGEGADGAHIAYFLAWAFGHDALAPRAIGEGPALPDALRQREAGALLRLLDSDDGRLSTTMLTDEMADFARARYVSYLNAYPSLVARAGRPEFHSPTWEAFDDVSAGLDELFEEWRREAS